MINDGNTKRNTWKDSFIQYPGWFLFVYLVYSQGIPAINYEWGVHMGTQDSAQDVTEVGACFWYGFAVGDLIFYIPLLGIGLKWYFSSSISNNQKRKEQGKIVLAAALGITIYWPIVCLTAATSAHSVQGFEIDIFPFLVTLPLVILWALISFCLLVFTTDNRDVQTELKTKSE